MKPDLQEVNKFEFYKILNVVKMQRSLLSYWHSRGDTTCEDSISEAYRKVCIDAEKLIKWIEGRLDNDMED